MPVNRPTLLSAGGAVYLVIGLWAVHTLHVCRFLLVDWKQISAFPDWQISTQLALVTGGLLLLLSAGAAAIIRRYPMAPLVLVTIMLCELASQLIGRSLFKLIGDLGVWGTLLGGYVVRAHYGPGAVGCVPRKALAAFHAEALGMLRTVVNVCLFVIGTLGIAVTSNLISQYFDTALGQGTAWVHVGTMLYLASGMGVFILYPLFQSVTVARSLLGKT